MYTGELAGAVLGEEFNDNPAFVEINILIAGGGGIGNGENGNPE